MLTSRQFISATGPIRGFTNMQHKSTNTVRLHHKCAKKQTWMAGIALKCTKSRQLLQFFGNMAPAVQLGTEFAFYGRAPG